MTSWLCYVTYPSDHSYTNHFNSLSRSYCTWSVAKTASFRSSRPQLARGWRNPCILNISHVIPDRDHVVWHPANSEKWCSHGLCASQWQAGLILGCCQRESERARERERRGWHDAQIFGQLNVQATGLDNNKRYGDSGIQFSSSTVRVFTFQIWWKMFEKELWSLKVGRQW